jgi:hypothetical protein
MSYHIVNGRIVEDLDRMEFFEPAPKKYALKCDMDGNIHIEEKRRKPIIKRTPPANDIELVSMTGKRKITEAFGITNNDEERYGQEISDDFFKNNTGHSVVNREKFYSVDLSNDENEIIDWCYKYLASKGK